MLDATKEKLEPVVHQYDKHSSMIRTDVEQLNTYMNPDTAIRYGIPHRIIGINT